MATMRVAGEEGALEFFLEQYRIKCDHFGDDPHPAILRIVQDALNNEINLTSLTLNGQYLPQNEKIADDDVFAVSESLTALPDAPFVSIDLSFNSIGNNGAKALSVMLKTTQSLSKLNLHANEIGEIGGLALAHALEGQRTIMELDFSGNPLGDVARLDEHLRSRDRL